MKMEEATRVAKLICDLHVLRNDNSRPKSKGFKLGADIGSLYSFSCCDVLDHLDALCDKYTPILAALIETEIRELERKIVAELKALGVTVED